MHIYLRIEGEIMNQKPTVKEIQEEKGDKDNADSSTK
jgi:hypothetical protein